MAYRKKRLADIQARTRARRDAEGASVAAGPDQEPESRLPSASTRGMEEAGGSKEEKDSSEEEAVTPEERASEEEEEEEEEEEGFLTPEEDAEEPALGTGARMPTAVRGHLGGALEEGNGEAAGHEGILDSPEVSLTSHLDPGSAHRSRLEAYSQLHLMGEGTTAPAESAPGLVAPAGMDDPDGSTGGSEEAAAVRRLLLEEAQLRGPNPNP